MNSLVYSVQSIYQDNGIRGFWKGGVPSAVRVCLGLGVYFVTLESMRDGLQKYAGGSPSSSTSPSRASNLIYFSGTFLAGATSRMIAAGLLMPVTVVKTRLEWERNTTKSSNMFVMLYSIWKKEKLRGLFSGFTATMYRDAPASGLYMVMYDVLKDSLHGMHETSSVSVPPSLVDFTAGMIAGGVSSGLTQPFDVIRTRMQLQQSSSSGTSTTASSTSASTHTMQAGPSVSSRDGATSYRGFLHAIKTMAKEEGLGVFYYGTISRIMKRTLSAALTWTMYEEMKRRNINL